MDDNARQMLAAVQLAPPSSLLCPDYLYAELTQALPGAEVVPYCARGMLEGALPAMVVVHKGQMRGLGRALLRQILEGMEPVLANPVFVVFRQPQPEAAPLPPEQEAHIGVLREFAAGADTPRRVSGAKRAAIVSAYGVGNVGDDAVSLSGALMAKAVGCTEITYTGPAGRVHDLPDLSLVMVSGGGLIYDRDYQGRPDVENIGNYTTPLAVAREMGIPSAVLGIGVQGIHTALGAAAYRHGLAQADLLTVRDTGDQAVLEQLLGREVPLTADLAFALPSLLPAPAARLHRPLDAKPLAILALAGSMGGFDGMPGGFATFLQRLAMALSRTHEVVLAQHATDDARVYRQVATATGAGLKVLPNMGPERSLEFFRQAELVVTSRYHGLIFGLLAGARVLPIGDGGGKIGRLVAQRLPSLEGHTLFVSGQITESPEAILALPGRADPAEVEACIAAAMANMDLLSGIVR
ncbi:polysaccharide pyruvyl transferase family protein [Acetobacteraceae bacterium H6797]|nr:polysaccharide pyruvyl transferase family protein [Acetobacteraceae bacterium H6797]